MGMNVMTERTLLWFWNKAEQYQLSCEAISLWLDFYSYLQQNEEKGGQLSFEQLWSFSNLERALFWQVCMELTRADMMEFVMAEDVLLCRMCSDEPLPMVKSVAV